MYITGIIEKDYLKKKDQKESGIEAFVAKLQEQDTVALMREVYSIKRDDSRNQRSAVPA